MVMCWWWDFFFKSYSPLCDNACLGATLFFAPRVTRFTSILIDQAEKDPSATTFTQLDHTIFSYYFLTVVWVPAGFSTATAAAYVQRAVMDRVTVPNRLWPRLLNWNTIIASITSLLITDAATERHSACVSSVQGGDSRMQQKTNVYDCSLILSDLNLFCKMAIPGRFKRWGRGLKCELRSFWWGKNTHMASRLPCMFRNSASSNCDTLTAVFFAIALGALTMVRCCAVKNLGAYKDLHLKDCSFRAAYYLNGHYMEPQTSFSIWSVRCWIFWIVDRHETHYGPNREPDITVNLVRGGILEIFTNKSSAASSTRIKRPDFLSSPI